MKAQQRYLAKGAVDLCQLLTLLQVCFNEAAEVLPIVPAQLASAIDGQAQVLRLWAFPRGHTRPCQS